MPVTRFVIGLVGAPFGVNGFVKIHSCSGETDHLLKLQSVIISKDGKEQVRQIEESTAAGGSTPMVHMRFAGISTPEEAKTLNGAQLLASREQAAPLGDGEYYIEDLKGLPVLTSDGTAIGCITDIIEGGGGELAEIKLTSGEKHLIPFRSEFLEVTGKNSAILKHQWILEGE